MMTGQQLRRGVRRAAQGLAILNVEFHDVASHGVVTGNERWGRTFSTQVHDDAIKQPGSGLYP